MLLCRMARKRISTDPETPAPSRRDLSHLVTRVHGPVGALAGVVFASSHLHEAFIQAQVMPDGVLEQN